jgi:hypothetical protein
MATSSPKTLEENLAQSRAHMSTRPEVAFHLCSSQPNDVLALQSFIRQFACL